MLNQQTWLLAGNYVTMLMCFLQVDVQLLLNDIPAQPLRAGQSGFPDGGACVKEMLFAMRSVIYWEC
jgi:hypothetical protein